jgi:hypothetical protein
MATRKPEAPITRRAPRLFQLMLGLLVSVICLGVGFFTIFRWADAGICYRRTAGKLGVEPNRAVIYQYVDRELALSRDKREVMQRLERVGKTVITGTTVLPDGDIREGVEIRICSHPFNNIAVILYYSADWTVEGFSLWDDLP